MAGQLQLELERLTNQARFISMIVNKELVVSGRKKVDIVAELRKKDFRPFPKVAKAKQLVRLRMSWKKTRRTRTRRRPARVSMTTITCYKCRSPA